MAYNKKVGTKELFFVILTLVLLFQACKAKANILYPAAFTVVRYSLVSNNFTTYMKNIGYPNIDQSGNNIGYNIISLDGYKSSMTFSSMTNDLSPLGTWANLYARILGNTKSLIGKSSSQFQSYIVNQFHKRGAKILFNAFTSQRPVSQKNVSATVEAQNIGQFISMYNFDGVSIDFDDFHSVKQKTASQWLLDFLKTLRKQIGKDKIIVLQTYPTFITQIPLFRNSLINSFVDLFVIKYYNVLKENYNDFESIFNKATVYNGTAIWEIQKNSQIKMDICKTLIAKPTTGSGTFNSDAYVASITLNNIFQKARNQYSWFGGYANLDFGSDSNGDFQMAALSSLRTYCNRYETCFCW